MRFSWLPAASAAFVTLLTSSLAMAMPTYPSRIPNGGENTCANCHLNPRGGGPRNPFGIAFASNGRRWSAGLAELDSDGDGQTNGQELGDPCGTWSEGMPAPRTTAISLAGDSDSTSSDPTAPPCGMPDAGMPDAGMPDAGMPDAGVAPPADAGMATADGGVATDDAGMGSTPRPDDGGCSAAGRRPAATLGLVLLALVAIRRRK